MNVRTPLISALQRSSAGKLDHLLERYVEPTDGVDDYATLPGAGTWKGED
jgi:hypothetical protein